MVADARLFVACAMLLPGACNPLRAQKPAFDVVSVKASGTNRVVLMAGQSVAVRLRSVSFTGERVTCNTDLRTILREAYSVEEFQIVGGRIGPPPTPMKSRPWRRPAHQGRTRASCCKRCWRIASASVRIARPES